MQVYLPSLSDEELIDHLSRTEHPNPAVAELVSRLAALLDAEPNPFSDSFVTVEKHTAEIQLRDDQIKALQHQLKKKTK